MTGSLHVIQKKIECYVNNSASTDMIFVLPPLSESCEERNKCKISDVHTQQTKD